jgi:hypothetical protein
MLKASGSHSNHCALEGQMERRPKQQPSDFHVWNIEGHPIMTHEFGVAEHTTVGSSLPVSDTP